MTLKKPRILLGAAYSSIEPLGLFYLAGLARDMGWEPHIRLVINNDFTDFHQAVKELKPSVVGYTLYTGNHEPLYAYFDRLKKEMPGIRTIIGGPHATYFPVKSKGHADLVVVSEGFDALARILKGEAADGILYPMRLMPFPLPERKQFYTDYPEHRRNPIKNVISMTGCPFACTYCYNSSGIEATMGGDLSAEDMGRLKCVLGASGRLFPMNLRTVDSVLQEIRDVMELAPETKQFYWQDDTLGVARHISFLRELKSKSNLGIAFHGQTRFEMLNPENARGREVIDLLRSVGFTGMTMAIEAADYTIRKEVLNRVMPDSLIFNAVKRLRETGFRLRTEQITGLPYGATSVETPINLDADLGILKMNMDLRRHSGGLPNLSWATTLIPYMGTRMSDYCIHNGFVTEKDAENPEMGYHERSVLRHVRQYIGPGLEQRKNEAEIWMSEQDQERYRDQNTQLRYNFHILAYLSVLPDAERFVEHHLRERQELSVASLNTDLRVYLNSHISKEGQRIWKAVQDFEKQIPKLTPDTNQQQRLRNISAYCGFLPGKGTEVARRFLRYSNGKDDVATFSNIVKKYLFDTQVYLTEESTCEMYDGAILSDPTER